MPKQEYNMDSSVEKQVDNVIEIILDHCCKGTFSDLVKYRQMIIKIFKEIFQNQQQQIEDHIFDGKVLREMIDNLKNELSKVNEHNTYCKVCDRYI